MAIPSVGGGYQYNDGNLNEVKLSVAAAPATATASATLTVAQLTNGIILGSPGTSAAAYAGVYAVNPQTRQSTGSLQQFVVTADATASSGNWSSVSILN